MQFPYFGKIQVAMLNQSQNRIKFVSKNYTMTEAAGKKGSKVFSILTPDQPNILLMTLEVYKNGGAYLYINASERSSISFDGYIIENLISKEVAKN